MIELTPTRLYIALFVIGYLIGWYVGYTRGVSDKKMGFNRIKNVTRHFK